jgi:subtilisin family serine protease
VANADSSLAQYASIHGFSVLSEEKLGNLGISVTRLSVPTNVSFTEARTRLKSAFPNAAVDFNHVYAPQANMTLPAPDYAEKEIRWSPSARDCGFPTLRLGMLDTLADLAQPLLSGAAIQQQQFLDSPDAIAAGREHGSTVAALLAGQRGFGLLPRANLFIAGIFTLDKDAQPIASATSFVTGLDWLAGQGVRTVNISLSGPRDSLMELAINAALSKNISIVAAVGNDGFSQVPRYPAAFPGVLGVTAVDMDRRPFPLANSGSFVAFAAPGVDLWIPAQISSRAGAVLPQEDAPEGNYVSGTSFAAPFVAAALAVNGNNADSLAAAAIDLGASGKDMTFGYGLIQASTTCIVAGK